MSWKDKVFPKTKVILKYVAFAHNRVLDVHRSAAGVGKLQA